MPNPLTTVGSFMPSIMNGLSGAGSSALNGVTSTLGGLSGANTTGDAGTGASSGFNGMLASFVQAGQQNTQNQVAMENAQLQVNQQQQIDQQMGKTAEGAIDKMDVK